MNLNAFYYIPEYYYMRIRKPVPDEPEARGIPYYGKEPEITGLIEIFVRVEMKIRPKVALWTT